MSMELDDDVALDEPEVDAPPATAIDKRQTTVIAQDITRVQSQLTEFDRVAAGLATIEERYPLDAVYDVSTTKGMEAAKEHRAAYRDPRIAVEKARKSAKAPLIELGKNIESRAAWITARLAAGEEPVHAQIKAEGARREQEKQDKINAEAGRVLAIQEALAGISQDVLTACGKASSDVAALLASMRAGAPDEKIFQEMTDQARAAWTAGIAKLETTHKAKLWDEAEARRIADERAADEKRRAEEQATLAEERAAQAAEAARLAKERAQLARDRAELEALRAAHAPAPVSPAPAPEPAPTPVEPVVQDPPRVFDMAPRSTTTEELLEAVARGEGSVHAQHVPASQLNAASAQPDNRPPLTTGAVSDRLAFIVAAGFVERLGITPAPRPEGAKAGTFWRAADFPRICDALVAHINSVRGIWS